MRQIWFRLADGATRHFATNDYRATYEPGEYIDGVRIVDEFSEPPPSSETEAEACHATP